MSALAEVVSSSWQPSVPLHSTTRQPMMRERVARERGLPVCAVCSDSMIAAEASALTSDDSVIYLWTCETCGYGFVTKHGLSRYRCN